MMDAILKPLLQNGALCAVLAFVLYQNAQLVSRVLSALEENTRALCALRERINDRL